MSEYSEIMSLISTYGPAFPFRIAELDRPNQQISTEGGNPMKHIIWWSEPISSPDDLSDWLAANPAGKNIIFVPLAIANLKIKQKKAAEKTNKTLKERGGNHWRVAAKKRWASPR